MFKSIRSRIAKTIAPSVPNFPIFDPRAAARGQQLGRAGLPVYFPGFILDERLPELYGRLKYTVYEEMGDQNAYCAASLNAYSMFIRRAGWGVDPVVKENEKNGSAEFLQGCMGDMQHSWRTIIATAARAVPQYGFSPHELVYKPRHGYDEDPALSSRYDDDRIGWSNLAYRAPPTILHWVYDKKDPNRLLGLRQLTPPDFPPELYIPREKLLILRAEPGKDSPEGRSILRSSYRPHYIIKYTEDYRNIIIERGGAGIPRAKVPPNITNYYKTDADGNVLMDDEGKPVVDQQAQAALNSIIETLKSLRLSKEPYVIVPQQFNEAGQPLYDIDFLIASGSPQMVGDMTNVIREQSMAIFMSMMTEFLALGTGNTGSLALSRDKTDSFTLAITSYLDAFEDSINNQAVVRLFQLNPEFEGLEVLPRIVHEPIVPINIKDVASFFMTLPGVGYSIKDQQQILNAALKALGLPETIEVEGAPATGDEEEMEEGGEGTDEEGVREIIPPGAVVERVEGNPEESA